VRFLAEGNAGTKELAGTEDGENSNFFRGSATPLSRYRTFRALVEIDGIF
jgi:hypothetical protein